MIAPTLTDAGRAMPFQPFVRSIAAVLCLGAVSAAADDAKTSVQLFDSATDFGWKFEGPAKVDGNQLKLGGPNVAATATYNLTLPPGEVTLKIAGGTGKLKVAVGGSEVVGEASQGGLTVGIPKPSTLELSVGANASATIESIAYIPKLTVDLFDGKTLKGWKPFTGDAKREKSTFAITPAGELSIKNGPGDLQTEAQFADFLVQLECKTNGAALNSGLFFRCLPGQYQQGYEAQIQNAYLNNDRTKPVDFGTGAIYRRIATRKVNADDHNWFTMTVYAKGDRIATWVNGYPTVNWKDDRKPADNARQGLRTAAGALSLQGHDPTTDLLFKSIRLVELK
jgi:hypothetical protein